MGLTVKCGKDSNTIQLLTEDGRDLIPDLLVKEAGIKFVPEEAAILTLQCYIDKVEVDLDSDGGLIARYRETSEKHPLNN